MKIIQPSLSCLIVFSLTLAGCDTATDTPVTTESTATEVPATPTMTADEFVADVNRQLDELNREAAAAQWIRVTYITPDTAVIAAKSSERMLAFLSEKVEMAKAYEQATMSEDTARAIKLLKLGTSMPAPRNPAKRAELAEIATRMEGQYGEGKYCPSGPDSCKSLTELEQILADKKHDYAAQLDAWTGWHTISPKMRNDYTRFVELTNEGARELGFTDLGEMWKAGYDMTPTEFEQETERLWGQVKPLYDQLHCYVRDKLADHYGEDKVSRTGAIPAHLLGNMWAQQWGEIYDLVEPYPGLADLNLNIELEARQSAIAKKLADAGRADAELEATRQSAVAIVEMAEDFYTSVGMPQLPDSFWERSMLIKPRDREVVCHASAWTMDGKDDVRIKQCILPTGEELFTVFHELGHVYYDLMYKDQPMLFQGAAHDGFHEAIGDTVNLSMTSEYLHKLGLISAASRTDEAIINEQMKLALDKIAFLPFGKMIDQWRWAVFDGRISQQDYNKGWWDLRTKYQGIVSPVARTEADFDPGAKYHIPGNTPYTRYFLSFIMQFQFHKALCEAAGHTGPLYQCSVYGNKEAGERFMAMLKLGASRPWQEALEQLTGTRQMDAAAIIEYFQPLLEWLQTNNANRTCGW
ncbi:MAG: peptidase M20 [Gammaproteobacteria bacterium]|nr:peptidase M20 [Gammaproteobacteria bacterium]